MLKVNDKNNNVIDVILVSSLLTLNIFNTYSTVSIVDIEQVIVPWVSKNKLHYGCIPMNFAKKIENSNIVEHLWKVAPKLSPVNSAIPSNNIRGVFRTLSIIYDVTIFTKRFINFLPK